MLHNLPSTLVAALAEYGRPRPVGAPIDDPIDDPTGAPTDGPVEDRVDALALSLGGMRYASDARRRHARRRAIVRLIRAADVDEPVEYRGCTIEEDADSCDVVVRVPDLAVVPHESGRGERVVPAGTPGSWPLVMLGFFDVAQAREYVDDMVAFLREHVQLAA